MSWPTHKSGREDGLHYPNLPGIVHGENLPQKIGKVRASQARDVIKPKGTNTSLFSRVARNAKDRQARNLGGAADLKGIS